MSTENFDDLLREHEFVLVNFYTDWCGFSRMLAPIYEDAAQKLKEKYPEPGKVLLGKVNGDSAPTITARYKVNKYPTLKIFRYGAVYKREYRGQRSVDAIVNYVQDMLSKTIIHKLNSQQEIDSLDYSKRQIIGYLAEGSEDAAMLTRVAALLYDDCQFNIYVGDQGADSSPHITFRHSGNYQNGAITQGPFVDLQKLQEWATGLCLPLVRELTFENAEELTEAGLPFFILFYKPGDEEVVTRYRNFISSDLAASKDSVMFLTADGSKFTHPINHLGKSVNDLPIIVIDSFQHMYIWKHDVKTDLEKPGLIKQFIDDLYSQKLHREFHQGPDPTNPPQPQGGELAATGDQAGGQVHLDVQHQVLVAPDGTRVQVLRVVTHDQPHADVKPALDQAAQKVEELQDTKEVNQAAASNEDGHIKRDVEDGDANASSPPPSAAEDGRPAVQHEQVIKVTVDKTADKGSGTSFDENEVHPQRDEKSPPESVFKKLLPSPQRYSITRRDEL